jgi:hypothetical protein
LPGTGIKVTSSGVEIDPATTLTNTSDDANKPVTSAHLCGFIGDGLNVSGGSITVNLGNGLVLDSSNPKKVTLDLSPTPHYQNGNPVVGTTTPLFIESANNKFAIKVADSSGYGVVQLQDSIADGVTTKVPTVNAVYDAIAAAVEDLEGADFEFVIAAQLPDPSADYKQKIYLIPISGAAQPDTYSEYVCINTGSTSTPSYRWEKIGDTNIDLSGYIQKTDVLTSSEISTIVTDVFGF